MNKFILLFIYYSFSMVYFSFLIELFLTYVAHDIYVRSFIHYPYFLVINVIAFIFSEILKFKLNKFANGAFE